jgi:hypothetical protein
MAQSFLSRTEGKLVVLALLLVAGMAAVTITIEQQRRAQTANPETVERVVDQRAWNQGGTLHEQSVAEFRDAEARDRMATAADFLRSFAPDFVRSTHDTGFKKSASDLALCINRGDDNERAFAVAARCRGVEVPGEQAPDANNNSPTPTPASPTKAPPSAPPSAPPTAPAG